MVSVVQSSKCAEPSKHGHKGFTLIELLVVLTIMATLLSIVAPRYLDSVDRAKEAALKTNLRMLRESIDKYKADTGQYPENLNALVEKRYLRSVPMDPVTDRSDSWKLIPPPSATAASGVYDVRSTAPGQARDGSTFVNW